MVALPPHDERGDTMTRLPTVCFLTGTLNAFAGAERMTAVIANGLAERGYRVFVLSMYDHYSVFPLHQNVAHHAMFDARPSFKRAYLATVLGIRRFLRTHEIDVLVEVDTMLTLFTVPATIGTGVRRVGWEHCHFDEDLGRPVRRVARRIAALTNHAIVVLTERDREQWRQALSPRAPVSVIGNSLPFTFPEIPASREGTTVLAVGRLVPAKGFDVLIAAWEFVSRQFPDWRLRIVGEGEERGRLEALIRAAGSARIELPGAHARVAEDYLGASVFCLSSRYEGFGLVLLEAMAFGLPVVSTDCQTGPKSIVHDGVNGLSVPVGDARALAEALIRLMRDAKLSATLAKQAREHARLYRVEVAIDQWTGLLRAASRDEHRNC
ncbi:glycosyltransferase family 4 protein [Cupriavidus sp. EM10]|uniref:glycosyltransferase family 4 protein n=2 Tax=unclassified Cupriavidus TaxID=2640874 RepID=UPI001CED0451|nr:glycosyltransferase family 4 protein [Cupriavidus sp. EM10]